MEAYDKAVKNGYMFGCFGDSLLILTINMHIVYLSLGTNLGNRKAIMARGDSIDRKKRLAQFCANLLFMNGALGV